jgi:TPR repeat protein
MTDMHPTVSTIGAVMLAVTLGASYVASGTPASSIIPAEPKPSERLSRNMVTVEKGFGDSDFLAGQTKALSGDAEAALHVAQMFRYGSNGVPQDDRRMLQWLVHASSLRNGAASYQLYKYFLERRLDRDAVFFERRALEQGYRPPPRLNPRRG